MKPIYCDFENSNDENCPLDIQSSFCNENFELIAAKDSPDDLHDSTIGSGTVKTLSQLVTKLK